MDESCIRYISKRHVRQAALQELLQLVGVRVLIREGRHEAGDMCRRHLQSSMQACDCDAQD